MPTSLDRAIDLVNEGSDAVLSTARGANERLLRFSNVVLEEAQRTQRENSDLARAWLQRPGDLLGLYSEALETWTRRQRRRLELTRTVIDDVRTTASETSEAAGRVVGLNREAVRTGVDAGREVAMATVSAGREAVARASERVSEGAEEVSEMAENAASEVRRRNGRERS